MCVVYVICDGCYVVCVMSDHVCVMCECEMLLCTYVSGVLGLHQHICCMELLLTCAIFFMCAGC